MARTATTGRPTQGLNDSKVQFYNLDAAWQLSANWKTNAYASFGKQNLNMQQGIGYIADLEQKTFAAGLGFVGTIKAGLEVGGELSYLDDKTSYNLAMTTAGACTEPARQLLSRHHPEALGEIRDRQEIRCPARPDPAVGGLQRLDLGIQRRSVHVLGQFDSNDTAEAERHVPWRPLHLQV
jgi:hypothetical protein